MSSPGNINLILTTKTKSKKKKKLTAKQVKKVNVDHKKFGVLQSPGTSKSPKTASAEAAVLSVSTPPTKLPSNFNELLTKRKKTNRSLTRILLWVFDPSLMLQKTCSLPSKNKFWIISPSTMLLVKTNHGYLDLRQLILYGFIIVYK